MLIEEALLEGGERSIVQARDGVEALEYLQNPDARQPDLIVLDLNMPRMNGAELLAILKDDEQLKAIPVVMLTTSRAPEDVATAYRRHANAFVAKPVNLDDFNRAVRSIDSFYLETAVTLPT
jgi:CheY-like chemotaxis protein